MKLCVFIYFLPNKKAVCIKRFSESKLVTCKIIYNLKTVKKLCVLVAANVNKLIGLQVEGFGILYSSC